MNESTICKLFLSFIQETPFGFTKPSTCVELNYVLVLVNDKGMLIDMCSTEGTGRIKIRKGQRKPREMNSTQVLKLTNKIINNSPFEGERS